MYITKTFYDLKFLCYSFGLQTLSFHRSTTLRHILTWKAVSTRCMCKSGLLGGERPFRGSSLSGNLKSE